MSINKNGILGITDEKIEKMKKEELEKLKEKYSLSIEDMKEKYTISVEDLIKDMPEQKLVIKPEIIEALQRKLVIDIQEILDEINQ